MTIYTDTCLRANDFAAMVSTLPWARMMDEDGNAVLKISGSNYVMDCIGSVVSHPGEYDNKGNEITPPVIDMGFHLNLRTWGDFNEDIPEELVITPSTPHRVFA